MAYSVDNIIPVDIILTPAGLGFASFTTAFVFARQDDLKSGVTFDNDTFRDYSGLTDLAEDFETTSDTYRQAVRWFSQIPRPPQISVWMWNDDESTGDSAAEVAAKAVDEAWRYFLLFPKDVTDVEADVLELVDFCDAEGHFLPFVSSNADAKNPAIDTDIGSVLAARGNRRVFYVYRETATITGDPTQAYAATQLAAVFQKFRPEGNRTAITAEFQVLPGVVGESLSTTAYNALRAKDYVIGTQVELQGQIDASRIVNSKTPSAFGEFIDDVINVDVLKNRLQVNGYNYIANAGTKRPLDRRGYAGLLGAFEDTLKQFFNNGVLGEVTYTDEETGEDAIAKYGYVILSRPEDVDNLTQQQRIARQYPETRIRVFLARAGHEAAVTVNVE